MCYTYLSSRKKLVFQLQEMQLHTAPRCYCLQCLPQLSSRGHALPPHPPASDWVCCRYQDLLISAQCQTPRRPLWSRAPCWFVGYWPASASQPEALPALSRSPSSGFLCRCKIDFLLPLSFMGITSNNLLGLLIVSHSIFSFKGPQLMHTPVFNILPYSTWVKNVCIIFLHIHIYT